MSYASEVLTDSPRVYYTLGESSGNPQDSSGNGLHVTQILGSGSPSYGLTGPISGITAMSFNVQALSRTDDNLLDLGDVWTLECWVKRNATGQMALISKQDSAYYMRFQPNGTIALIRANQAGLMISTESITDTTTWHHVVGVKNGIGNEKIYIDGDDAGGSDLGDVTPCANNAYNLLVGADEPTLSGDTCNQQMGHIAVYATALSGTRVAAHYQAGMAGRVLQSNFLSAMGW